MRYLVLACDYDGTIAHHGRVDASLLEGLERVRASGRAVFLVSGRHLEDLAQVFPHLHVFDRLVLENGALLYDPAQRRERLLCEAPPPELTRLLEARGVPVAVGRGIVATREPHETVVLEAIRELGLELQVIFNKGAVMVLPAGVNKATGLDAALAELGMSAHNVLGVGDAENDHAFLRHCECAVAVQNALPMVKESADLVMRGDHGTGVLELIEELLADDLRALEARVSRHRIPLGTLDDGRELGIEAARQNLLLAGISGGGKSTTSTGLVERLVERGYQVCVVDPEGDYETLDGVVTLGNAARAPAVEEVMSLLRSPAESVIVSLVGLPFQDRPTYFLALLPRLAELRARTGRPHRIVVDEAHHMLHTAWDPASIALPKELEGLLYVTVSPAAMSTAALETVDTAIAVGADAEQTLAQLAVALGEAPPEVGALAVERGQALVWARRDGGAAIRMRVLPGEAVRRRHLRKYAEGELGEDRSFYFRGPDGRLNLRAQNLILFMQLGDGVDDETWLHHLRRGDFSRWFRDSIKDAALADAAEAIERTSSDAAESRRLIRTAVEARYTLPASAGALAPG